MTISLPPISYPAKPKAPFTGTPPENLFPDRFPTEWKNITGKPYITVSSKGLANGLSEYINDGADFGPDSLQADGTLTTTSGIQEAEKYLRTRNGGKLMFLGGIYYVQTTVFINGPPSSANVSPPDPVYILEGTGANINGSLQDYPHGTWIRPADNFDATAFGGWLMVSSNTDDTKISFIGFMGMNPSGNITASGYLSLGDHNIKISKNVFYDCVNGLWVTLSGNAGQIPIISDNQSIQCTNQAFTSEQITINGTLYSAFDGDGGQSQARFTNNYDSASNISYWFHARANNRGNVSPLISQGNISDQPIKEGFHVFHRTLSINDHVTIINSTLQSKDAIAIVVDNTSYNADYITFENFCVSDDLTTTEQSIIQTTGGTYSVNFTLKNPSIYEFGTSTSNPIYNGNGTIKIIGGIITTLRNIVGSQPALISTGLLYYNYTSGDSLPVITYIPSLSANPPVSGTVYINSNPFDINISVPITFPVTASTAMTAYLRVGTSTTAGANPIFDQFSEPATLATVNGRTWALKTTVPAGSFFEVDVTNATIGTVQVRAV